ncbi:hypothetical protein PR003_g29174 [Phytophthora rubi]|uniref:RxLR effector protein n=1 Tax=Phytophthora rubi TaxID=129364 RepID=A0A6A3HE84_9STRA|nr:hypothetical protein PR002_g28063 [Phytophthora rubi]KAE8967720.1 hypothetical protein PR001_g28015 [Phytophthora rubi]KAE9276021.1 hypothetical protein PR003_g29174 [Phytophthora rubi]
MPECLIALASMASSICCWASSWGRSDQVAVKTSSPLPHMASNSGAISRSRNPTHRRGGRSIRPAEANAARGAVFPPCTWVDGVRPR